MGRTTSVDVTKSGIDKAYGIRKLRDILGIKIDEMIFIGMPCFLVATTIRRKKQAWCLSKSEIPMRLNGLLKQLSLVWIAFSKPDIVRRMVDDWISAAAPGIGNGAGQPSGGRRRPESGCRSWS
jgi:hypothetical protein